MKESKLNLNMLYTAACKCCILLLLLCVANVQCCQKNLPWRTVLKLGEDRNETNNDTNLTEAEKVEDTQKVEDTVCKDSQLTVKVSQLLDCVSTSWTFECDSPELTGFMVTYHFKESQRGQSQLLEPNRRKLEVSMEGRERPFKVCVHALSKGSEIKKECGVPYLENIAVVIGIVGTVTFISLSALFFLCICCSDVSYEDLLELHQEIFEKQMEKYVLDKIEAGKTCSAYAIKALEKHVLEKIEEGKTCDVGLINALEKYVMDKNIAGKTCDVGLKKILEMYAIDKIKAVDLEKETEVYFIDMNKAGKTCDVGLNDPNGYGNALYSHDQRDKSQGGKDVVSRADQIKEKCLHVASSLNGHGVLKAEESTQQVGGATLKQEVATAENGQEKQIADKRPGQDVDVSSNKADVYIIRL